ncbi:MAG: class I SAM-dependent methyltransferase [Proteobacteria bacterium]|nr:class I SAM-dependent methyltransferase [Pseudomonadota bacterium]
MSQIEDQRNTQPYSEIVNDARCFWDASNAISKIRELSHWQGVGPWADQKRWEENGQYHFSLFEQLCTISNTSRPINSMLEWGPGGGLNAVSFAREVERFCAVEISLANLEECGRQITSLGFEGFEAFLIDIERPEEIIKALIEPVDFFLCTSVFQHMPNKLYGNRVTTIAHRILKEDGLAIIHIRYDDGTEKYRPKKDNYKANVLFFTSFRIEEYWQIAKEVGFQPLSVILDPKSNGAYYLLKKGR